MSLNLPTSPYTAIYREVIKILKENPTLHDVVKSWKEFVGKSDDFAPPPISAMPSIATQFSSSGMSPWSQGAHEETMVITLELAVVGTNADDLMDLWWAVLKALKPHTKGRKRIVAAAKGADECTVTASVDMNESALKHTKYREDRLMVGIGSIAINMIIKE